MLTKAAVNDDCKIIMQVMTQMNLQHTDLNQTGEYDKKSSVTCRSSNLVIELVDLSSIVYQGPAERYNTKLTSFRKEKLDPRIKFKYQSLRAQQILKVSDTDFKLYLTTLNQ